MGLKWVTRYYTLRELNPTAFAIDDLDGDVAYYFEVVGYQGKVPVATLKVTIANTDRYIPVGHVSSVEMYSRILPKKFWWHNGRVINGDYVPCEMNTLKAISYVEKAWENKLTDMGLVAIADVLDET